MWYWWFTQDCHNIKFIVRYTVFPLNLVEVWKWEKNHFYSFVCLFVVCLLSVGPPRSQGSKASRGFNINTVLTSIAQKVCRWQVTGDRWHMTRDTGHVKQYKKKSNFFHFFLLPVLLSTHTYRIIVSRIQEFCQGSSLLYYWILNKTQYFPSVCLSATLGPPPKDHTPKIANLRE